jgi:hypothetical protein
MPRGQESGTQAGEQSRAQRHQRAFRVHLHLFNAWEVGR